MRSSAIRETSPGTEVIMLTGHGSIDTAIESIRQGAFDYVAKPCPLDELEVAGIGTAFTGRDDFAQVHVQHGTHENALTSSMMRNPCTTDFARVSHDNAEKPSSGATRRRRV